MSVQGFEAHDHANCIEAALGAAEARCAERKLNFTKTRRRVLEILLTGHKAMGAYDILQKLAVEGLGAQPPVVYRALDFLVTHGLVHKVERINAYVACVHPEHDHAPAFLICRKCETVAETMTKIKNGRLSDAAFAAGFEIEQTVIEASGLCPKCKDATS